jgi:hypothetical protein
MEDVIRRLLSKAFLFDDPSAYAAGVEDAIRALDELRAPLAARPEQRSSVPLRSAQPTRDTTSAV